MERFKEFISVVRNDVECYLCNRPNCPVRYCPGQKRRHFVYKNAQRLIVDEMCPKKVRRKSIPP
jgi:predicted transcriptional regulator